MIPYAGPELAKAFRTVRNNTIQTAEEIPEDKYGFRAAPETRSIAQMLVHLVHAPVWAYKFHAELKATNLEGFDFTSLMASAMAAEQNPPSKAEILAQLRAEGDKLANWVAGVTPEFLAEMITFPAAIGDPPKSRFEMLLGVKEHEMHHRGQLMMMQRMLGQVPHLTRRRNERMARFTQQAAAKS
jgi:uncharacterized damage-inducible protein DinB